MKKITSAFLLMSLVAFANASEQKTDFDVRKYEIHITQGEKSIAKIDLNGFADQPFIINSFYEKSYPAKCDVTGSVPSVTNEKIVTGHNISLLLNADSDKVLFTWGIVKLVEVKDFTSGGCTVQLPQLIHRSGMLDVSLAIGKESVSMSDDCKIVLKRVL
ncbi:MAG: hypothetical protein Q7K13_05935 [Polynucleobacter sp.]|uniref:hypothetical protein n=1 Tax=Polynucleobacter sp. TaxID=2029855 RepID=UPI0027264987|nr:hypothetical protein [Polynucleobacter sp.]MDO8714002.1 hypothetical protein [Polynucleobacter sp.]